MSTDTQENIFVRIIELPKVKMARSGPGRLDEFNRWWSAVVIHPQNNLCPRDFMWFNPQFNDLEWGFVLPENMQDTNGYAVFDFPGGLYAVAACKDEESDIGKTSGLIHQWVEQSGIFQVDPNLDPANLRYDMGHIITPINARETLGYHQMELFVPIVYTGKK